EQSNGVPFFGKAIRDGVVPLPRVLARAGYQTAFTGKWHNVRRPDEYGFEWMANMFLSGMGHYRDPKLVQRLGEKPEAVKGFSTELFADAAIRFLEQRDPNRPFYLYLSFTAPHDPREPLERFERMYPSRDVPLPVNFMPRPRFDPGTLDIRDEKLLPLPRDPEQIRIERGRYFAQITHMDEQIGRVLARLDELKLADRTIVVFAGDNGLTLGAHGLLGKQTLYDEGVRIPLIMRHPKLPAHSRTSAALVNHVDILPTVFEWVGVPLPEGVEGRSLAGVYAGRQAEVREAVFGRYDERDDPRFRSIRTTRYKLIRYLKLQREELFDLQADPYELKDLSEDPSMQEVKQSLRARLKEWVEKQGDQVAVANWF
ncbi:MAG: sulfatase-like hydrolase/transferase, partial [Phycisphaerae bacterium]